MNTAPMNLNQIRQIGLDILVRELGPVGMIRFLQQFEIGQGDYTVERHSWLVDDVGAILNEIKAAKQPKTG